MSSRVSAAVLSSPATETTQERILAAAEQCMVEGSVGGAVGAGAELAGIGSSFKPLDWPSYGVRTSYL